MADGEFRIPSLDGIRALAALTVFISHVGLRDVIPGGFGVTVFFFLSGFLITTLLRMEWEKTRDISLKNFYLRRALPHLAADVHRAADPDDSAGQRQDRSRATPAALARNSCSTPTTTSSAASDATLIPGACPMWSLAVEEHFYLMFPLGLLFLLRRHRLSAHRADPAGCVRPGAALALHPGARFRVRRGLHLPGHRHAAGLDPVRLRDGHLGSIRRWTAMCCRERPGVEGASRGFWRCCCSASSIGTRCFARPCATACRASRWRRCSSAPSATATGRCSAG